MEKNIFLSVVIPSYNEGQNIKRGSLEEVYRFLKKQDFIWELILSDDGSTDDTVTELKKFAKRSKYIKVLANKHSGKGPTVKKGMLEAKGQWRLFTDFDQSTPISEVEKLISYMKNYDVIIGSREGKGAQREKEPIHRHLMGRAFNFFVRLLTVPGIRDTQCGFKLFSAQATEILFNKLHVYNGKSNIKDAFTGAFDVELLYLAVKHKFKIKEVPIIWKHYQTNRVSPVRDSFKMFRDIVRIRTADLMGKY